MNLHFKILVVALMIYDCAATDATHNTTPKTVSPQPAYQPNENPQSGYIPHATYPYGDIYGAGYPGSYEGYFVPPADSQGGYVSSVIPTAKGALQTALRVIAKVGLFLVGGMVLLIVGGLFTTAVCSITPFCTITFNGFGKLSKEAVRSYMTPETMAHAAAFVEDAVNKYQRIQRGIRK